MQFLEKLIEEMAAQGHKLVFKGNTENNLDTLDIKWYNLLNEFEREKNDTFYRTIGLISN